MPLCFLACGKQYLRRAGDTLNMTYRTRSGVDVLHSTSFESCMFIADNLSEEDRDWIGQCAAKTPPPSAPNKTELRGNSQTWCIEVLKLLLPSGIGTAERLARANKVRDRLPYELIKMQQQQKTRESGCCTVM